MAAERARLRLFVEAPLAAGRTVDLAPAQAHYVVDVMRRREGESLLLFNGRDGEWRAEVDAARRGRRCTATVVEPTRPQAPEPDLWLMFAPVKRAPIDLIARGATELGVSALWPVLTRRTAVRRVNLARLRANATEAAEQCGRLTAPECFAPTPLAAALADWPPERRLLVCDESGAGAPVARALTAGGRPRGGGVGGSRRRAGGGAGEPRPAHAARGDGGAGRARLLAGAGRRLALASHGGAPAARRGKAALRVARLPGETICG